MKFLNKFIIILSVILIVSLGSAKAETLEEIAGEINDLRKKIANLDTTEVKGAVTIDKALTEINKTVDFVNVTVIAGDIEGAIAALNFADQVLSDISNSVIPKEFETEVVKKGKDFSAEKISQITEITNDLNSNKEIKNKRLIEDMLETNVKGLNTIEISQTLNEIGIQTINSDDIEKAISLASQASLSANKAQALNKALDLSKELKDQARYSAIIGTSAANVDLALRQVEALKSGDPKKFRAFEYEKYGKELGLSIDKINKGIEAVYSGNIDGEKQIIKEIVQAMEESSDWELQIEFNDAVLNGLISESLAVEKAVKAILKTNVFEPLDLSSFTQQDVVIIDVDGWIGSQKEYDQNLSDFSNTIGNILAGAVSQDKINNVKYDIGRTRWQVGTTNQTVAAQMIASINGDEYSSALTSLSHYKNKTLAEQAAMVEATLMGDYHSYSEASYSKEVPKLTDSQKSELSQVYKKALEVRQAEYAKNALEEVKIAIEKATETAQEVTLISSRVSLANKQVIQKKQELEVTKKELEVAKEITTVRQKEMMKDYTASPSETNRVKLEISKKAWNEAHKKQFALDQKQGSLRSETINLQWNADKLSRDLVSAKTSALTAKNKMNTATQNAAILGISVEKISQVASASVEATSAATIQAAESAIAATQKAFIAAKAAEETAAKAAEQANIAAEKAAKATKEAIDKSTKKAAAKIAEQVAVEAAVKASAEAKRAAEAAQVAAQNAATAIAKQTTAKAVQKAIISAASQAAEQAAVQIAQAAEAQQAVLLAVEAAAKATVAKVAATESAAKQLSVFQSEVSRYQGGVDTVKYQLRNARTEFSSWSHNVLTYEGRKTFDTQLNKIAAEQYISIDTSNLTDQQRTEYYDQYKKEFDSVGKIFMNTNMGTANLTADGTAADWISRQKHVLQLEKEVKVLEKGLEYKTEKLSQVIKDASSEEAVAARQAAEQAAIQLEQTTEVQLVESLLAVEAAKEVAVTAEKAAQEAVAKAAVKKVAEITAKEALVKAAKEVVEQTEQATVAKAVEEAKSLAIKTTEDALQTAKDELQQATKQAAAATVIEIKNITDQVTKRAEAAAAAATLEVVKQAVAQAKQTASDAVQLAKIETAEVVESVTQEVTEIGKEVAEVAKEAVAEVAKEAVTEVKEAVAEVAKEAVTEVKEAVAEVAKEAVAEAKEAVAEAAKEAVAKNEALNKQYYDSLAAMNAAAKEGDGAAYKEAGKKHSAAIRGELIS